ncbi:MAG: hypothetical protein KDK64_07415 [Chlamydiia bacterium]|nr:hypothetical protein [Chlamydiia bacterium]
MKGLLTHLILVLGALGGSLHSDEVEMDLQLSTDLQMDRDLNLIQNFLLFSATETLCDSRCSVAYELGGRARVTGPEEIVHPYALSLSKALEHVMYNGMSEKQFEEAKEKFISSLGQDLDEKALAEEIQWGMLQQVFPYQMVTQASPQQFYQLRLTHEDQKLISEMITDLGELGWFGLLKKKSKMEKIGDKIFPVHPLRFIGYVLATPSLKKQLPNILNDFVKRKSFFGGHGKRIGFGQRMTNEDLEGNLRPYIPGFAQQVGVSEASIMKYFDRRDWEELVRHLM